VSELIEQRLDRIEGLLSQLICMVAEVKKEQIEMKRELADMNERLDRIDGRLDLHRNQISKNTEDIELLKEAYWKRQA
jgi:uncharacterized protein (UPF0305 family)